MHKIVSFMNEICARPGTHLASTDVRLLQAYIQGYLIGLAENGSIERELEVLEQFERFVHSEYKTTDVADGKSWSSLVRERTESDSAAFVEFRSLWNKFLQSHLS